MEYHSSTKSMFVTNVGLSSFKSGFMNEDLLVSFIHHPDFGRLSSIGLS